MATATMVPIATQTLGSAAASITFSSIPGTYTDLRLVLTGTCSTVGDYGAIQYNADTASNYSLIVLSGYGTGVQVTNTTSAVSIQTSWNGASSTTIPAMKSIDILSYAGSTNKTCLITASTDQNGTAGGAAELTVGLWRSTAAITSIKLSWIVGSNFATGTIATLFGI